MLLTVGESRITIGGNVIEIVLHAITGVRERGERSCTFWLNPTHAAPKFGNHIDRVLHEVKRGLHTGIGGLGDVDGEKSAGNFFNGSQRETTKICCSNFREQRFHNQSDGIVMCKNNQCRRRSSSLLEKHDW